jgi:hypothetical protein
VIRPSPYLGRRPVEGEKKKRRRRRSRLNKWWIPCCPAQLRQYSKGPSRPHRPVDDGAASRGGPWAGRRERFSPVRAGRRGSGSVGVWCRRATCRFSNWPLGRPGGPPTAASGALPGSLSLPGRPGPIGTFSRRGPPVGVARWLSSTPFHRLQPGARNSPAAREIFVAPPPNVSLSPRGRRSIRGWTARTAGSFAATGRADGRRPKTMRARTGRGVEKIRARGGDATRPGPVTGGRRISARERDGCCELAPCGRARGMVPAAFFLSRTHTSCAGCLVPPRHRTI